MTLRSTLTDIADHERQMAEAAVTREHDRESIAHCFSVIEEYARKRIERIVEGEKRSQDAA